MVTAYKSRCYWVLSALEYAMDVVEETPWEDSHGGYPEGVNIGGDGVSAYPYSQRYGAAQLRVWTQEARKAMANAVAPSGSDCLTRLYAEDGTRLPR